MGTELTAKQKRELDKLEGTGVNTKFTVFTLATKELAKDANENDPESMYNCLQKYLSLCAQYDMRISETGCYMAIGITSQKAKSWLQGKKQINGVECQKLIQNINDLCTAYRQQLMLEGKLSPVTGIWYDKVYGMLRDDVPVAQIEQKQNDGLTAEQLADKYKDVIIDESEPTMK